MNPSGDKYDNVDDYIARSSVDVREILRRIRSLIKKTAPDAIESISYGIPAYRQDDRPLVYFAGFKNHIGFYATPQSHENFSKELAKYKQGKGSVQFPLNQPIPYDLIEKMVSYKLKQLGSED